MTLTAWLFRLANVVRFPDRISARFPGTRQQSTYMQVPSPPPALHVHCGLCLLYPQKRTLLVATRMSALCQKRVPSCSARMRRGEIAANIAKLPELPLWALRSRIVGVLHSKA